MIKYISIKLSSFLKQSNFFYSNSNQRFQFLFSFSNKKKLRKKSPLSINSVLYSINLLIGFISCQVCQVAVSPNNKWVSSFCVNNFLKLWSACNNEEHFSIQLRSQAVKLQFTLDSKHLAVLSEKKNVCIFKVHEGKTFKG